ncbi:glycoside hydrolase family 35 protein [Myceligenerans pegani]|uniref:Beta-galactosidase n=1 Tax=Myceligenerans pegani TaxID=2776917 RepID=A0ABR9MTM9_9MICO|nr:beta-galactosidase family protein [Myceligenerans sp. TRM 65318]MBE1874737.1 beta-galactosidase [Myceligenerans sp. TRM 65318]MBE3017008.1 beta-galactosidase [Myceligenerans sp. TRM 65318]
MSAFEIGERDFLLDGKPLQLVSGALHYFRVHPDLWADRIRKARLMGLNAVETYVPWNFHAPSRGEFRTTGRYDLGRFLDLVAAEGLHAIVRPGPYICAEWDGGGLPAWLFADDGGRGAAAVRCADPAFLDAIGEYFGALLPIVAKRQVTAGGPVLAVQVENEYGAYGDDPPERREAYLRALVDLLREHLDVPLFTVDQASDHHLSRGGMPGLHKMASFGSRASERLEVLRRHQPTGPLMCMEFWNGWFDSWGQHHHVAAPGTNAQDLDDLLAAGASVNSYMFHGGTNFGLTSGANDKGTYLPITTSYDYDAPLAEHGAPTPKFFAMREVIGRYREVPSESPPAAGPAPALTVPLGELVPLARVVEVLGRTGRHDRLPTHDDVRHWSGLSVYTTRIRPDDRAITFGEVRDRAIAFVDGAPAGTLSRTLGERTLPLPPVDGELTLLVEDQGRVNYGPRIGEAKGLIGPARTASREVTDWSVTPLELEGADGLLTPAVREAFAADRRTSSDIDGSDSGPVAGPVLCRAEFTSEPGADHFLRLDGWTKGLAWVNGWPLGRYWSHGPTRTMYVPGPVMRKRNELVVLELHGASSSEVSFVPEPDLGHDEE